METSGNRTAIIPLEEYEELQNCSKKLKELENNRKFEFKIQIDLKNKLIKLASPHGLTFGDETILSEEYIEFDENSSQYIKQIYDAVIKNIESYILSRDRLDEYSKELNKAITYYKLEGHKLKEENKTLIKERDDLLKK